MRTVCSLALAIGLVAVSILPAQETPPGLLKLKTQRVIAFKDGYCLVIKRGEAVTDENGQLFLDEVPDAAVLGSFWATPDEGRLSNMVAGWKEVKEQTTKETACVQTIELLVANKGREAKIELHDKTTFSGVIQEVLIEHIPTTAATSLIETFPDGSARAIPQALDIGPNDTRTTTMINGSNFLLRTEAGDVMLQASQVRSILVKDMKTTLPKTFMTTRKTKRLTFAFDKAKQKHALTVMYFRPGVRWIPTYRIELDPVQKGKAKMALQAELLNEAEDLTDAPIDIVVGVPNFRFRQTPSPLVLESVLRNALAEAEPTLMGGGNSLSNAMYSQRSAEFRRDAALANAAADGGQADLPGDLTASGAQDLFVYSLPKLSIAKSERAAVPIFTADVPYRDIYTWDVHITREDVEAAPSGSGIQSPLVLSNNQVWHQIVLTNSTNLPWTTGAALLMQSQKPLSQELLTYTPAKNDVRVPVTVSVETRGSFTEKEIARDLRGLQWDDTNYVRIDKLAQLHFCNNKPIEIEVEITVKLGGKVDLASHDGKVTLNPFRNEDWVNYRGHPAVNNSSEVAWKLKLKPGETFEPTVDYHYFTRN